MQPREVKTAADARRIIEERGLDYVKVGVFDADGLEVAGDLFMSGGAQFKKVRLLGAKVGRQLNPDGSTFDGLLIAKSARRRGEIAMRTVG